MNISRRDLIRLASFSTLSVATMSFTANAETTAARQAGGAPTATSSEVRCAIRNYDNEIMGALRLKKAVINEFSLPDGRKFSILIADLPPDNGDFNVAAFNVKIYQEDSPNLDRRLIKDINITDKTEILSKESMLKFFIST